MHNGSWNVSNEVYRCEVPEAWTWAGSPPIELDGDFELSMNVDFPNPPGDVVGRHGGFMFYASGATSRTTTSGYTIDWIDRAADHGFRFIKWNNGRPTETIVNGTPGVAEPPTLWELSVVGDQITFRGDGEEIFSVAHSEFRAGHFGLWSYSNSDMEFDNVEIFTGPSSIRPCFSASPSSGDAPLDVDFDGRCSSDGDDETIIAYQWNFGDGQTANGETVSHVFQESGAYNVVLTVVGNAGTRKTSSRTIDVFDPDTTPDFDVDRVLNDRVKRYGAEADSTVVFNEFMYHPPSEEAKFEWIELYNQMGVDMDLSNWFFGEGVAFEFPRGTIIPGGGFLVIASDPDALEAATGVRALGPYFGRLANGGEDVRLFNRSGREMAGVRYNDGSRWPVAPDGSGVSLAKIDPLSPGGQAANWAPSEQMGGTPGAPNFPAAETTVVVGSPGLRAYWSLDESTGSVLDSVGGNSGTVGSAVRRVAGLVGDGALEFDNGSNSFVNVGVGEEDSFVVTEGVTIEALVKLDWNGAAGNNDMIFRKEDGSSRILLGFQSDGNDDGRTVPEIVPGYGGPVLAFGLRTGDGYSELELPLDGQAGRPSVASLRDGTLQHIAATYDAASGRKSIYLDGELAVSTVLSGEIRSGGIATAYIGNMTGRSQPFTGVIDELAFWGRALSAVEIAAHHDNALAGKTYFEGEVAETGEIPTVAFNEFIATDVDDYSVELVNFGDFPVQLENYSVSSGNGPSYQFPSQTLGVGSYLVRTRAQLGFDVPLDGKLFLYTPDGQRVVDAFKLEFGDVEGQSVNEGRYPEGTGRWLRPEAATLGVENRFAFNSDIVINEIHYHPRLEPARADVFDETILVGVESLWRYEVSGADLGTAWRASAYDDGDWPIDEAPFYQESSALPAPKNTEIELGPTTFYFRKEFDSDGPVVGSLQLRLLVDDGCVVYLNGAEVYRLNMPDGVISASTFADTGVGNAAFDGPITLSGASLRNGSNVIAVEVHQASANSSDVVFAAELFASVLVEEGHPARDLPESWVELLNRSNRVVDLSGWDLDNGINFEFAPGTLIAPGEFLVVAEDVDALSKRFPGVPIVGPFRGRLSNRRDRIALRDELNNPVDEVEYFDGGRWPDYADGGGSSLELRDADADNSKPEAWAASDETGRTEWRTYSYRQVATANFGPTKWREFVVGMIDAGEILIDDISVIQAPSSTNRQLLQNVDFEGGSSSWRILGNHRHSEVIDDPDRAGNKVLHLIATGPTEHMHNHLETTLVDNTSAPNGVEYEVSFRARWLAGSNLLNTRLYFNRIPRTTPIDVPSEVGTPGAPNTARVANIGPTYDRLAHVPVVPDAGEPVVVSVFANDPDGVDRLTLWYSVQGGAWQNTSMSVQDGEAGLYSGRIPGQSGSRVVQFYVEARDDLGATSHFPAGGRDSRALYETQDGQSRSGPIHNFRIVMLPADTSFMHSELNVQSNERLGATVIYREEEAYYDVGVRLKGSQRGRVGGHRVSFSVRFPPHDLFRGVHGTVSLDRSGGWGIGAGPTGQDEIVVKHVINQAGLPGMYDDIAWLVAPRSSENGPCLLMMAKYGSVWRRTQFPGDSEGTTYKVDLIYYPTTTNSGSPEGFKRPQPDTVVGTDLRNLGDDPEAYRWTFLLESNLSKNDYSRFIELCKAQSSSTNGFAARMEEVLDTDEATRMYVMHTLCGIGDTYWFGFPHNVMLFELANEGRFVYLGWDDDVAFTRGTNSALWGGMNLSRLYSIPEYQRLFFCHLHDVTSDFFNSASMRRWTEHYGELAQETGSFGRVLNYIGARSSFARSQLPAQVGFSITTNSGNDFTVDTLEVTIEGRGWIDVRSILVSGRDEEQDLGWPTRETWRTTVTIAPGRNELSFFAFDHRGNITGTDSITVTSTAEPPPDEFVRGDANRDDFFDVSDVITTLLYLFDGLAMTCEDAADSNDDETLGIADASYSLNALFLAGPQPPAPYPGRGVDTTGDDSLQCEE